MRQNKAQRALQSARKSATRLRERSKDLKHTAVSKTAIAASGYGYGRIDALQGFVNVPGFGAVPKTAPIGIASYAVAMMTGGYMSTIAEGVGDSSLALYSMMMGASARMSAPRPTQGIGALEERLADELDDAIAALEDGDDVGWDEDDVGQFVGDEEEALDGL